MHRLSGSLFSRVLTVPVLAFAALLGPSAAAEESSGGEIDATVWQVIMEAVAANDLEGMAATYHPDAVLVSTTKTVAIAKQLTTWGEGMERIRREGRAASVAFRFESRQDDATTAFQRGIFRYAETDANGVGQPAFVPFEALLVKQGGRWLMLMERQLEAVDQGAWDALGH